MTRTPDSADARLDEGIRLFNAGEFFACHDVWEDLWMDCHGPEKTFFQGLIHAAVSLHHFEEGNAGGAVRMYGTSVAYLQAFDPVFRGIDVTGLLTELEHCFQPLLTFRGGYPHGVRPDSDRLPVIVRTESPPGSDSDATG